MSTECREGANPTVAFAPSLHPLTHLVHTLDMQLNEESPDVCFADYAMEVSMPTSNSDLCQMQRGIGVGSRAAIPPNRHD